MQKQSPLLRIWSWGKDEHVRLIGAGDHRYAGRREGAVLLSAVVKPGDGRICRPPILIRKMRR